MHWGYYNIIYSVYCTESKSKEGKKKLSVGVRGPLIKTALFVNKSYFAVA